MGKLNSNICSNSGVIMRPMIEVLRDFSARDVPWFCEDSQMQSVSGAYSFDSEFFVLLSGIFWILPRFTMNSTFVAREEIKLSCDFTLPRPADFGAAISGANKFQCQQVLEELEVYKRLNLTLELVKKEMEISHIQELGLEIDDKIALTGKFRERIELKREKCRPHVLQL